MLFVQVTLFDQLSVIRTTACAVRHGPRCTCTTLLTEHSMHRFLCSMLSGKAWRDYIATSRTVSALVRNSPRDRKSLRVGVTVTTLVIIYGQTVHGATDRQTDRLVSHILSPSLLFLHTHVSPLCMHRPPPHTFTFPASHFRNVSIIMRLCMSLHRSYLSG